MSILVQIVTYSPMKLPCLAWMKPDPHWLTTSAKDLHWLNTEFSLVWAPLQQWTAATLRGDGSSPNCICTFPSSNPAASFSRGRRVDESRFDLDAKGSQHCPGSCSVAVKDMSSGDRFRQPIFDFAHLGQMCHEYVVSQLLPSKDLAVD